MAVGCGPKCAKLLLIIFNFFFWLSGAAVLGVGIWLRVDKSILEYLKVLTIDPNDPVLNYAAYVLIAMGAFVFIVGFFGCCGAIRESKCMLGLYMLFMVIVMVGELAAGIVAALYKSKVEAEIDTHTVKTIKNDYISNSTIGNAWDFVQYKFKCCGALGPKDYTGSKWMNDSTSNPKLPVPYSCCKFKDTSGDAVPKEAPIDTAKCIADATQVVAGTKTTSDYMNIQGCKDSLLDWFKGHAVIMIGIGIGIAGLEIFGFIFAVCLCRNLGEEE